MDDGPTDDDATSSRLRPPEPATGVWQETGADPQHYGHNWLNERSHLGVNDGHARCRKRQAFRAITATGHRSVSARR